METTKSSGSALFTSRHRKPDLVCFSHLRWDFVYQRPQHLLSRFARDRRVFFIEEPILDHGSMRLEISERDGGVRVVVPHLPAGLLSDVAITAVVSDMIDNLVYEQGLFDYVLWYYTPMALPFARNLKPLAVVYDCMDELSAFKNAPAALCERERELFQCADLVFTGGQSLYEVKRALHPSVHAFPSSIDRDHFMRARLEQDEPEDQKHIPHPRLGFFGVLDERFDAHLLNQLAEARPDWQFVMIGPVVKIDPADLPQRPNIHYLGGRKYADLPSYIAGWDVALLLFAQNDATRFISPTKTPEYLASGKPVVSTPIRDVVKPYGELALVQIAGNADEFIQAIESALAQTDRTEWLTKVDKFLAQMSWDDTWSRMSALIDKVVEGRKASAAAAVANLAAPRARAVIARGNV